MLINEIGVADEQVVDIETRRADVATDPKARETLAMAIEAELSHASLPSTNVTSPRHSPAAEVTDIDADRAATATTSRTDAA